MDTSAGLPWVFLFISWRTLFNMQFPSCWLVQFGYLVVSCLTLCNPMDCSTPVHHQLPELTQTRVSAIRVVSSAYLRLLIFLPAILISACASSSPAFLMMYSAYKLNKQGDHIQPWRTPFPIWNQSVVPCLVLTVASWPAYRFLRRQAGQVVCIPIFLRIFHSLWWCT